MFVHRDRVEKVTPADVQRVAAAYLKPSNRTVGLFLPTDKPDRAEVPSTPSIPAMVAEYKGRAVVQAGEAFDPSPKNIESRTLRSTLPVGANVQLLSKQTRGDRVFVQLQLRHGTEQTLRGKTAIADLTADMLERGTTALTREQVKDSLDKLKARVNIGGAANTTNIFVETTRPNLLPTLALVAQVLRTPRFDAAEFEKLKQENLAQIEQFKTEPQVLAFAALNKKLMPVAKDHPLYSYSPDEQAVLYSAATLDDVKAFYRSFYGMSYADIAAIGSFDADSLKAAIVKHFGDWKSPQPFARLERKFTALDSGTTRLETPDKANAVFAAGQNLQIRDDDADYAALAIANTILGGGFLNSRLATRIRQKEGLSYGVGSGLSAQALDRYGVFQAFAIYAPQNVDRLAAAFQDELQKMLKEGFTAQEVEAAKSGYLQQRVQQRANDNELIGTLVSRRFAGRTLTFDEKLDAAIGALTVDQVNAAARKYIDPSKIVIVRAGDFAKHPPEKPKP